MVWIVILVIGFILFLIFPRAVLIIVGLAVAAIVLTILYAWQQSEKEKRLESKVSVLINYDVAGCSAEFPLLIRILNNTNETVTQVDFNVSMKRSGYSTDLARFGTYKSDRIIPEKEGWESCWRVPDLDYGQSVDGIDFPKLEYGTSYKSVSFQND